MVDDSRDRVRALSDTECLEQAFREHNQCRILRDQTAQAWDELTLEERSTVVQRAQRIKEMTRGK